MDYSGGTLIAEYRKRLLAGDLLSFDEAFTLANECCTDLRLAEITDLAREVCYHYQGKVVDLCSIVNARSGKCSENCKFCAQSSYYSTSISTYELVDFDEAISMAHRNAEHGVSRFSLVTAGRSISLHQLEQLKKLCSRLVEETSLSLCASMGMLTLDTAKSLREMGVLRYHCNLETSRSFFPSVCTTHSWDDKIETIGYARQAGLDICSGGIIGLGESLQQRLELAFELRNLDVRSIPINILSPIANTPFEHIQPLGRDDILLAVAMFRLINPNAVIRTAGGRNILGNKQQELFLAGASGAIVGDYLTTSGEGLKKDLEMFESLGLSIAVAGDKRSDEK